MVLVEERKRIVDEEARAGAGAGPRPGATSADAGFGASSEMVEMEAKRLEVSSLVPACRCEPDFLAPGISTACKGLCQVRRSLDRADEAAGEGLKAPIKHLGDGCR